MTVIAMLSIAPVVERNMPGEVAKAVAALDDFEVSYETNSMGMVIEVDDIDELLTAVGAAHEAVGGDHVNTFLKIGDKCTRERTATDKIDVVGARLGREAESGRE